MWQPIETAPQDGRDVLVYGLSAGEINGIFEVPGIGVAGRCDRTDYEGFNWRERNTDAYAVWWKPTHWMPLPAAPETGK